MRISLNWLSDYIDIPFNPTELSDRLTMLGIEVESIENPSERMQNVVVGEVLEVTPHPNADKLRLTRVATGTGEALRIVCGAPNVRQGLKVAVATVGADLGGGFVIKKSKIRGEVSEGMLCSERELGLSEHHDGIWELPERLAVGANLADALGLNDVIFEIGITPNRADCLSHVGIAREIRAMRGSAVRLPDLPVARLGGEIEKHVTVELPEPELCPRYVAKLVRGVKVGPSPDWLKRRLEAVGLRPINNVVDVTNFVLMELGHPLHAFDFNVVEGGRIVVRTAKDFASVYDTLDGKQRKLPASALLITDGKKPLGIAGIMGGQNSAITDRTTDVLIESAYFYPSSIRRTAKLLGLSTDASYRFERGTDIDICPYAAERAAQLMMEVAGGEIVEGSIDLYPAHRPSLKVDFRSERARTVLGMRVEDSEMEEIFERLNVGVQKSETIWHLSPPSYRVDFNIEEDAIEEIARVYGYERIPLSASEPTVLGTRRLPLQVRDFDRTVRDTLLALGANECVSTPLVSAHDASLFAADPVVLVNPLNVEKDRMRSSLAINLLETAARNEKFGAEGQRLFEIGSVFHYDASPQALGSVAENSQIGILLSGTQEEKSPYNTHPLKADVFMTKGMVQSLLARVGVSSYRVEPASSAPSWLEGMESIDVFVDDHRAGHAGRVSEAIRKHFDLRHDAFVVVLDHRVLYQSALNTRLSSRKVSPLPKYPGVDRDVALVVLADLSAAQIEKTIAEAAPKGLLREVRAFDEFQSPEMRASGERSLAFRLVLRADDRTLEEREVEDAMRLIIKRLESELHVRLRA
jgi:phenylalanyl-tRNA synthetase beta chain